MRRVARAITPPIIVDGWRNLARRAGRGAATPPEWEYVPEGWAAAPAANPRTGWDVPTVRDAYREKLRIFRAGLDPTGPLAQSTTPSTATVTSSVHDQNLVLAFAYALMLAARDRSSVTVLDWGGGIGLFSLLGRALLPTDVAIDYHCKELPLVCRLGRAEVPDVQFHDDESCLDRTYDLVMASSSLQYSEPWRDLLERLASATSRYLYLARVPVVLACPPFVVRQRAFEHGLGTEYLSWVFNRDELLDQASSAGLELVREFLQGYKPNVHGAPAQDETRGFLFRAPRGS